MVATFRARRRIEITPGGWREPEQLLPEAVTWFRCNDWLHTGYITNADVTEDELEAAIAEFCPEMREQIRHLSGLDGARLEGPHNTPYSPDAGHAAYNPGAVEWAKNLGDGPLVGPVPRVPKRRSHHKKTAAATPA